MSRQSKLRNKARARKAAKTHGGKKYGGASGVPSRQPAPPWVGNGSKKPKAAREREAKVRAEQEAAQREAAKAAREAADVA